MVNVLIYKLDLGVNKNMNYIKNLIKENIGFIGICIGVVVFFYVLIIVIAAADKSKDEYRQLEHERKIELIKLQKNCEVKK